MLIKKILFVINLIYLSNLINCDPVCSIKAICNCKQGSNLNLDPKGGECFQNLTNTTTTINITELKDNYQLTCTYFGATSDALFPAYDDKTSIKLILEYPCPVVENHYSTGSILLIIFFTFFFTYFALGVSVNYFLAGARGIELIPNLGFWKDLPALILDGVKFIQNGCRPTGGTSRIGSEQEGYDAI